MDLIDPPTTQLDAAQVMAILRDGRADGQDGAADVDFASEKRATQFEKFWVHVAEAERHANVGVTLPPFQRFPRLIRPVARLVARVVRYVARFIVSPQRHFNYAVISAARSLADRAAEDGQQRDKTTDRIEELERTVATLSDRIDLLLRLVQRHLKDAANPPAGQIGGRSGATDGNVHAGAPREASARCA